ncbi:hypothetical protein TWF718_000432 [Orbilia javanica]|uniref:aldehyde dehydrogenase (NAD(+)) n=1 Tax=Orbilia javanica TaxID=47235 RepID=A0AAN8MZP7_9PEZI
MAMDFTTFTNIIGGKATTTAETQQPINPSTREPNPPVPLSTKKDLDDAVEAARKAFKSWSQTTWDARKSMLLKYANAILDNKAELAVLSTREQGKPLMIAVLELELIAGRMPDLAEIKLEEELISDVQGRKVTKRYMPLGVGGLIVPWNFPVMLLVAKIANAVLTGNTVICKPSPFAPYTGLKLVELAQQFFPPGVINILSGGDNLGPWMTAHPGIDKISFTGSIATGKKVMESCSKTLKRVTLEMEGKDPAIILPDIDIAVVAGQVAFWTFINGGQACMSIKKVYVHSSIAKEFVTALIAATKAFKIGDGFEDGVFIGPVGHEMQYEKVVGFIQDIKKEDGEIVLGGDIERFKHSPGKSGFFIDPTIVFEPGEESRIMKEEPFGPILPIATWDDEEDVIRRANNTDIGLGASVWGKDVTRAERIGRRLEVGSVWINEHMSGLGSVPFGGWKSSGIGVEYGKEGLIDWCNLQGIYVTSEAKSIGFL